MRLGDFWGAFNTESAPLLAMQFAARQFLLMALLEHHWSAAIADRRCRSETPNGKGQLTTHHKRGVAPKRDGGTKTHGQQRTKDPRHRHHSLV
jgi:hypothetical protein